MTPADCVAAYRALAEARLDSSLWRHLAEGEDADDARALAALRSLPRPLRDLRGGHTRLTLFGQALEHPIVLAPVAYQRLFHGEGEVASTIAAAAQGGQSVTSSLASRPFAAIVHAAKATGGPAPWFQLYWQGDRERTRRLLHRALDAGCSAVVFTVDAPVKRATLQLPPEVAAVNLEPVASPTTRGSAVFDGWMARAPSWDDLAWLRSLTDRPLVVKGLLDADDAERARALGCDGIVVSSHGGRALKGAIASIGALPSIVRRIDGRIPVLFDSGIRSGHDVFVALACGASAVLVGRPYVWGLAAAGAIGVAHVIRLLRDELEMTMALTGCARLDAITRASIADGEGRSRAAPA